MRSFRAFAIAPFLATIVLALPACSKPSEPTPPARAVRTACDRPGIPVTVFVTYDGSANPPVAKTINKTVYLCEEKDWVEWVSCDGEISEPRFNGDSPFSEAPKHEKKSLKSKPPKKGTAGKGFDYTMDFTPTGGGKPVPIDPRIEVMD
jgi:hypothetical protein